jgi:hypothetical protein
VLFRPLAQKEPLLVRSCMSYAARAAGRVPAPAGSTVSVFHCGGARAQLEGPLRSATLRALPRRRRLTSRGAHRLTRHLSLHSALIQVIESAAARCAAPHCAPYRDAAVWTHAVRSISCKTPVSAPYAFKCCKCFVLPVVRKVTLRQ